MSNKNRFVTGLTISKIKGEPSHQDKSDIASCKASLEAIGWVSPERAEKMETLLKQAQADYIEQHSDGIHDCVTPYDHY